MQEQTQVHNYIHNATTYTRKNSQHTRKNRNKYTITYTTQHSTRARTVASAQALAEHKKPSTTRVQTETITLPYTQHTKQLHAHINRNDTYVRPHQNSNHYLSTLEASRCVRTELRTQLYTLQQIQPPMQEPTRSHNQLRRYAHHIRNNCLFEGDLHERKRGGSWKPSHGQE